MDRLRNKSGPMSEAQREVAKSIILDVLSRTNIKQAAIEAAGIRRDTLLDWIAIGYITQKELQEAYEQYQDMLRGEIVKRTFIGVPKPLVANGRLVYDRDGRQVSINHIDTRLLTELAKRHLPEWQIPDKVDITTHQDYSGIPSQYILVIDVRELTPAEYQILAKIAQAIDDRKVGIVESNITLIPPEIMGRK